MKSFLELAATRRSIRKFESQPVPAEDIEYFVRAATRAPSGCDSQCWRFVAVKDRAVIDRLREAVIDRLEELLAIGEERLSADYRAAKRKNVSFFANAPLVIAVFMTGAKYYDPLLIDVLKQHGYEGEALMKFFNHYDLLSVGAAIQNLLLAVHEKGYGACWMNEPALAGAAINQILGIPAEQRFISLIPVGRPAYTPREKKLKDWDEVFSVV
jgi:nitroreductase